MSYAMGAALQEAVFRRLADDAALAALVDGQVHDALPGGETVPPLYVALGPERARDRSDASGAGAEHDLTVTVMSDAAGFRRAKQAAAAVCDALEGALPPLARGRLVALRFRAARARRVAGGEGRRIDLTFRARVSDGA